MRSPTITTTPTDTPASAPVRVQKARGATLLFRAVFARAYPRLIGIVRERSWLLFETILPLMATISLVFVYQSLKAPPEYIGFVILGGTMTAFWLNVLWAMATQLYWDKDAGNLELYVVSPSPLMAILLGMAIGGLAMSATRAAIILIVCSLVFQVQYSVSSFPLLIAVFFLTMAALYGMGMMFASIFLVSGRDAWHLSNLFQEPIYLLSGFYFPVKTMGAVLATAASVIPLTLGMDAMRQLMFPNGVQLGFLSVEVEVVILLVLAFSFITGAKLMLDWLERVGRRDGRLIERRR
jgi:ABC-2 type transport system permease protein